MGFENAFDEGVNSSEITIVGGTPKGRRESKEKRDKQLQMNIQNYNNISDNFTDKYIKKQYELKKN